MLRDVEDGLVRETDAESIYGVRLIDGAVDAPATAELRAQTSERT